MNIRKLTSTDLEHLLALDAITNPHPWGAAQWQDSLDHHLCIGLDSDGHISGYVIAMLLPDEVEILLIAVDPALQKQGLGRHLLAALFAEMARFGRNRLLLEVRESNLRAQHFYTAAGMVQMGKRKAYYPTVTGREDALLYSLELAKAPT